jgi:flagellar FliL protein
MSEKEKPPEAPEEDAPEAAPAKPQGGKRGLLLTIVAWLLVTLVAGGAGGGIGIYLADVIEKTVAAKIQAVPDKEAPELRYSGDVVLEPLEPIVTNLGDPSDTWIRLETAIVFPNGALPNPKVTAAEIRQDIVAYARTISIAQLEGPSALQHLREDLNERVAVRTDGLVSELVIETMVIQ